MNKLKELREKNSLSIKWVAKYLDLNRDTYSNYETNPDPMKLKSILKLCKLYKVTLNDLFENQPPNNGFTEEEKKEIRNAIEIINKKI